MAASWSGSRYFCTSPSTSTVWVDKNAQTSVVGIYAAGDTTPGTQQAMLAAAAGNQAAICLNENLAREEFPR